VKVKIVRQRNGQLGEPSNNRYLVEELIIAPIVWFHESRESSRFVERKPGMGVPDQGDKHTQQ
jgi:hypothetical protein